MKRKIEKKETKNKIIKEDPDYSSSDDSIEEVDFYEEEKEDYEEKEEEKEELIVEDTEDIKDEFYRKKLKEEDLGFLKRKEPEQDYLNNGLTFMCLKSEYDVSYSKKSKKYEKKENEIFLDLFGTTKEGYDVRLKVRGFKPYFYVEIDKKLYKDGIEAFKKVLNKNTEDFKLFKGLDVIVDVEKLTKKSVYNHSFDEKYFFKITVGHPQYVNRIRTFLENGVTLEIFGEYAFLTYESNIAFHIRCMIDKEINGSVWLEVEKDKLIGIGEKDSYCGIEAEVNVDDLIVHKPDKNWSSISPIRLISYDIECNGKDGHFPNAELGDPIITISCVIADTNTKERKKIILALNETAQTQGATTFWFDEEDDLLLAFRDVVITSNPDFMTGYNISKFDNSYLFKRAKNIQDITTSDIKELSDLLNQSNEKNHSKIKEKIEKYENKIKKLSEFFKLSKLKNKTSYLRVSNTYSEQRGSLVSENAIIYGRTNFDMLTVISASFKFNDYTLNTVSKEILKDQKNDIHHTKIPILFQGIRKIEDGVEIIIVEATANSRQRIAK